VTFGEFAWLFLPATNPSKGAIVEAEDWRLPPEPRAGLEVVLWGRGPLRSGAPPTEVAAFAAARSAALSRLRTAWLRRSPHLRLAAVHRLPPPDLGGGRFRGRLRAAALRGALAELRRDDARPRVVDAVLADAGLDSPPHAIRPSAGGGGRIDIDTPPAILKLGRSDGPGDPGREADGLERLAGHAMGGDAASLVPELLARGRAAGAGWSLQRRLPGEGPGRLGPTVMGEALRFAAALPSSNGDAIAHHDDVRGLGELVPAAAGRFVAAAARVDAATGGVPGRFRHGDLWAGNLLVAGGRLTGVVDWDGWHPRAVAGIDAFHLVGMDLAVRSRREVGAIWVERPWRTDPFRAALLPYWHALGLDPTPEQLEGVAVAWWLGHLGATLTRNPDRVEDDPWMEPNVWDVLDAIEASS
jgi:hypothetical protein